MKLEELGEFGFIERIKRTTKDKGNVLGIGDDCAIIPYENKEILISIDALVEHIHFLPNTDPYFLGRKSLAVNISDIAAMAGIPKWCLLSLSLRKDITVEWTDKFIKGFLEVADEYDVDLVGGDTTTSHETVINVTIVGENKKGSSIKRSTARAGDLVVISGKIGCSFAGLKAIKENIDGHNDLKMIHLNPKPEVKKAIKIKNIATSMIDISDGLIQDCSHIAEESGVLVELWWEDIPFCNTNIASKEEMICGGEDYCLLATVKPNVSIPEEFKVIGKVREGKGVKVYNKGKPMNFKTYGYTHF